MYVENKGWFFNDGENFNPLTSLGEPISDSVILELCRRKIIRQTRSTTGYTWNICGFLSIRGKSVTVFPKNFNYSINLGQSCLILCRTLEKYSRLRNKDPEAVEYMMGYGPSCESDLGISLYFFDDFREYGLIKRKNRIVTHNFRGNIQWGATVSKQDPVLSAGHPFYPNPYVIQEEQDSKSTLRMIHARILKECGDKWGWVDNFDSAPFEDSEYPCNSVEESIIILKKELRSTYAQREIDLISYMIEYLRGRSGISESQIYSTYYTASFHTVWEAICGELFNNRYSDLAYLIPNTSWHMLNTKENMGLTQIPDILTIYENTFYIIDAKYYDASKNLPGWSDVMKQYVYYLSLSEAAKKIDYRESASNVLAFISRYRNIFLLPGNSQCIEPLADIYTDDVPLFGRIKAYTLNCREALGFYSNILEIVNGKSKDYYLEILDSLYDGMGVS